MTYENFAYWLQGFFEIQKPTSLTEEQTNQVRQHLQLLFSQQVKTFGGRMLGQPQTILPQINIPQWSENFNDAPKGSC